MSAHTLSQFYLYFIFSTTLLFSNIFFPVPQFSIMFLVKFRKRSFLGRLNYHQYVFGSGILLDTVFLHSLCVLFCRPGMSWSYILLFLLNLPGTHYSWSDCFKSEWRGGKRPAGWRFLQLYSNLILSACIFHYLDVLTYLLTSRSG